MGLFKKVFNDNSYDKSSFLNNTQYDNDFDFYKMINKTSELNREIFIGSLTPEVADRIDRTIRFWNNVDEYRYGDIISERPPIKIYIDSFGGSLSAALTLVDSIKLSKTMVYTINIGTVYKEAFFVFLAGHKRFSYPRSTFLYERDLKLFDGMDSAQSNYVDFCEKQALELKDMLMEKTKITENEYEKRKSWWITPSKAYELHICNEVLRSKAI